MMNYEIFKEVVAEKIMSYMPDKDKDMEPRITPVSKVNMTLDGLNLSGGNTNISPTIYINDMYKKYGYFEDRSISKYFPGIEGPKIMGRIMTKLRTEGLKTLGGKKVLKIRDIDESVEFNPAKSDKKKKLKFPKSNVLQFFLEGGTIISARPSGTEPKIKFYFGIKGADADAKNEVLRAQFGK